MQEKENRPMADKDRTPQNAQEQPKRASVSRRDFIRKGAAVAAGAVLGASASRRAQANPMLYKSIFPSTVLGANERILTGHIGTGGMGRANLGFVLQRDDMQPIAVCDLYSKNLERGAAIVKQKYSNFTTHHDFREIIDNKDVDAVVIATPDHWHCLCTLYAADAKKDIYCEKPLSTTIEEGRAMVEAVRRNNVVFQGGTMQRSGEHFKEAVELVRSGYIGKVSRVETYAHDDMTIEGIGMGSDVMPEGCDWIFHQGWVKHQPFNTNRWIYNFRWFLDYSGGKVTDWGVHLIDIALWAMGDDKEPKKVTAVGGKWVVKDNRTTPDTLDVLWEYDDFTLSFSNRVWNNVRPQGYKDHGIIFYGTLGMLRVDRGGYEVISQPQNGGCKPVQRSGGPMNEPHWENFAQCVRTRQRPICDVEILHHSTRTCHMGTCAYVAGATLEWDPKRERFRGKDTKAVKKANAFAYRPYLNGWSLKPPYWRG
jgi:predicted dehydrogenase